MLGTLKSAEAEKALSVLLRRARRRQACRRRCSSISSTRCRPTVAASLTAKLEAYQKSKSAPTPRRSRSATRCCRAAAPGAGSEVFVENPAAAVHALPHRAQRRLGRRAEPDRSRAAADARADPRVAARAERAHRAGFGTVGITLKNGQRVDGTLRERRPPTSCSSRARRRPSGGSRRPRSPSAPTRCPRCRRWAHPQAARGHGTSWRI